LKGVLDPIPVQPLSAEQTVEVLQSLRLRYEEHHQVTITDEALRAAVELSHRAAGDRQQPARALEVLDKAGVRLKASPRAPEFADLEAEIQRLNEEKEAAVAEQDFPRAAHLRDLADKLKKKREALLRAWRETSAGTVDEQVVREVVNRMTLEGGSRSP
jgi:ATP-dependent Clp protease ATP-binding subunit ClpC